MTIMTPSSTIKDLRRMELSKELMRNEAVGISRRSRAGSWLVEERVLEAGELLLKGILVMKTTRVVVEGVLEGGGRRRKGDEEMSLVW